MGKFKKVLLLGAVATGIISNAVAATDPSEEVVRQEIQTGIHKIIKSQFDKGFLTEPAEIKINVVKREKVKDFLTDTESDFADLSGNHFTMLANQCKISLSFDNAGGSPQLSTDQNILDVTKFQNERQKEIMRGFVSLHEHFHCEFATIESPIMMEGKSYFFNRKMNYYLKDIRTLDAGNLSVQGYIDTLNENYADLSATASLIKEYGAEDKDLQYVLKAVKAQRSEYYLNNNIDEHFTHKGMNRVLEPESIKKIVETNDPNEFKGLMLKMANKSVQEFFAQRKDLAEVLFSKRGLDVGMYANLVREINLQTATPQEREENNFTTMTKDNVSLGFGRKVVKELLEGEEEKLKKLRPTILGTAKNTSKVLEFSADLLYEKSMGIMSSMDYNAYPSFATELKEAIYQQNINNVIAFDDKNQGEIISKIQTLRSNFLAETQGNAPKPN